MSDASSDRFSSDRNEVIDVRALVTVAEVTVRRGLATEVEEDHAEVGLDRLRSSTATVFTRLSRQRSPDRSGKSPTTRCGRSVRQSASPSAADRVRARRSTPGEDVKVANRKRLSAAACRVRRRCSGGSVGCAELGIVMMPGCRKPCRNGGLSCTRSPRPGPCESERRCQGHPLGCKPICNKRSITAQN